MERNEVYDTTEELNKHSSELSSCEAAPFFPSSQLPMLENSAAIPATFWRPWEDPLKNTAADEDVAASQKSLVTPTKLYFSSALSAPPSPQLLTPQGRVFIRAKKRRRSSGDLQKRRQRLISFQLSHTPPSSPSKSEPEQSSLESNNTVGHPCFRKLDLSESFASAWTQLGHRSASLDSNQTNPHLLSASFPQPRWPFPGFLSPPYPAYYPPPAPSPPTWLSDNMAPPSPAYCNGCQRWGNLLSVTVSQTRAH